MNAHQNTTREQFVDSLPDGTTVIMKHRGSTTIRPVSDDGKIPLLAASHLVREKIAKSVMKASEMQPERNPITQAQMDAWKNFTNAMGESSTRIYYESAMHVTDDIIDALIEETSDLLSHPACKLAYEQFLIMCKLALDEKHE